MKPKPPGFFQMRQLWDREGEEGPWERGFQKPPGSPAVCVKRTSRGNYLCLWYLALNW